MTKLRWRIVTQKVWRDFIHEGPGDWKGVKDGGCVHEPTGERVLQFYNEEYSLWEDVPEETTE